jgi:transposase
MAALGAVMSEAEPACQGAQQPWLCLWLRRPLDRLELTAFSAPTAERRCRGAGHKDAQFTPVQALSLDELVPADHFYRHLEQVLDLTFVRQWVQDGYAATGRPSIDPVVFFKLQLVMFFEGLRSERHLLRLVGDRLSVRWYLGYNLDEPLPDHSSLTRIRSRYGLDIFRRFFEAIVGQCQQAGLIWGRELYFDATHVLANASLDSLAPRFAVESHLALQAHLAALFPDETADEELALVPEADHAHEQVVAPAQDFSSAGLTELHSPIRLSLHLPESEWDALTQDNAARHDWIAEAGQQRREVHGRYLRTADIRMSTTDPDATPLRLKGGGTHLGYQTHYVVDGGKRRIILGVLVTPGEVMENQPMLDLAWHVRFRWKLHPRQVTGDTKYGTEENIRGVEEMGIRAYMPVPDWEQNSAYFGASKFTYDAEQDHYICPNAQVLRRTYLSKDGQRVLYRAKATSCRTCPLRAQCTPSTTAGRSVWRSVGHEYIERVQTYQSTAAYQKAVRKRQVWVEPLFAEGKQWHQMRRFRLRRLWRVNTEAFLVAAGQNLKRLLQRHGWGHRPFPGGMASATDERGVVGSSFLLPSGGAERLLMLVTSGFSMDELLTS